MQTTYKGIEISYNESENKWIFELRGRERSAESLTLAKEAIDKQPAVKKEFKRIPGYHINYSGTVRRGEITSIAEKSRFSSTQYVWFQCGIKRGKEDVDDIYVVSEKNDALIAECAEIENQIEALSAKARKAREKMVKVKLPEIE